MLPYVTTCRQEKHFYTQAMTQTRTGYFRRYGCEPEVI